MPTVPTESHPTSIPVVLELVGQPLRSLLDATSRRDLADRAVVLRAIAAPLEQGERFKAGAGSPGC